MERPARERVTTMVIMDYGNSPVRVAIDPTARVRLALQQKPVTAQGIDEFADRCIAQEVDEFRQIIGHNVTAIKGALAVSTVL